MKPQIIAIVLGLVGGVIGAFGANQLWTGSGDDGSKGPDLTAQRELTDRLGRLEAAMEARGLLTAHLEGRADPVEPASPLSPAMKAALVEEFEQELAERLEPVVRQKVEETVAEIAAREKESEEEKDRGKKRMALADVAREMELSAREEDDLRRIYEDTQQKLLEIMARPDGDIEAVKRDIEMLKNDEAAAPQLIGKYLPKMIGSIGDLMAVQAEQETRIVEAVGEDKAQQLGAYDIIEANPLGFGGDMRMEARMNR